MQAQAETTYSNSLFFCICLFVWKFLPIITKTFQGSPVYNFISFTSLPNTYEFSRHQAPGASIFSSNIIT